MVYSVRCTVHAVLRVACSMLGAWCNLALVIMVKPLASLRSRV